MRAASVASVSVAVITGGSDVSDNWDVPLISQVPLAMEIRAKMDSGESVVKGNSSQYADESFRKAARFIAASLWPKKNSFPRNKFG